MSNKEKGFEFETELLDAEFKFKDLMLKRKAYLIEEAEKELVGKYLTNKGVIFRIDKVTDVLTEYSCKIIAYVVSSDEEGEILICADYPVDLNFKSEKFEESTKEEFTNQVNKIFKCLKTKMN